MMDFDAVIRTIRDIDAAELEHWIAARWVRPEREGGHYMFHDIDVARVHLIAELRHDLAIEEETIPVVLGLLDQLYALRRRLRELGQG
ncbi:MAG TPA: chaperone modulator CbpM [Stellaceae bacterium]|nr:chaperone modulator CbpM [Stellaceae bacterium]